MAAQQTLAHNRTRSDIEAALAPHRSSHEKPPFTTEQLVAIALLLHDGPMTHGEIFNWINSSFAWYA